MVAIADSPSPNAAAPRVRRFKPVNLILIGSFWLSSFSSGSSCRLGMAVIWSLVDPETGWTYPDVLPPSA